MSVTFEFIENLQVAPNVTTAERIIAMALLWKYQQVPSYDTWADLVEDAIYGELIYLSNNRHSLQQSDEDAITVALVRALDNLGLKAARQVVGGNCDVTISLGDYLWIGEAKINSGVSKVWGGYLQLTHRYASGLNFQTRGGMLIYCKEQPAEEAFEEWKAVLEASVPDSEPDAGKYPLTFRSKAVIASTGQQYGVCHFIFPLQYIPLEKELKLTKEAFAVGRAAKKKARKAKDGRPSGEGSAD